MEMEDQNAVPAEPEATDPAYKMSIGQRILGAANNFLQGMAAHQNHAPIRPVVYTGAGAIDQDRLARAQQAWKAKYGPKPMTGAPPAAMPPSSKPPDVAPGSGGAGWTQDGQEEKFEW